MHTPRPADLSPTEREALQAFQEQEWTPFPVLPIGAVPAQMVGNCKVNDPDYFSCQAGSIFLGFQLTTVHGEQTDDGLWNVSLTFSPIPPQ